VKENIGFLAYISTQRIKGQFFSPKQRTVILTSLHNAATRTCTPQTSLNRHYSPRAMLTSDKWIQGIQTALKKDAVAGHNSKEISTKLLEYKISSISILKNTGWCEYEYVVAELTSSSSDGDRWFMHFQQPAFAVSPRCRG
jgi:hypothetical protein